MRKAVEVYFEDDRTIKNVETEWEMNPGLVPEGNPTQSKGPRPKIPTVPGYLVTRSARHPSACEFVAEPLAYGSEET